MSMTTFFCRIVDFSIVSIIGQTLGQRWNESLLMSFGLLSFYLSFQNLCNFCNNIIIIKGYFDILQIERMVSHQKLGILFSRKKGKKKWLKLKMKGLFVNVAPLIGFTYRKLYSERWTWLLAETLWTLKIPISYFCLLYTTNFGYTI